LDACDSIGRFVAGRERRDLDTDEMLLFALVRAIEVIGEAATQISADTRRGMPSIPWREVAGMRNRLVHAYFEVDPNIVWRTATADVPSLARALAHVRSPKADPGESESGGSP
jgi:uncharacterized protein with HEPN domain